MDMNTIISGVVMSKVCSIKADADSTESKNINLVVSFNGATLQGVFDKALSSAVIQWQNGVGRKNFDTYVNNQTVKVDFKSPGKSTIPAEDIVKARAATLKGEEKIAYLADCAGLSIEEFKALMK